MNRDPVLHRRERTDRTRLGALSPEPDPEIVRPNPDFDPEKHAGPGSDAYPTEVVNLGWSIVRIARVQDEEEIVFDLHHDGITWREIDDASALDPSNPQPPDRPHHGRPKHRFAPGDRSPPIGGRVRGITRLPEGSRPGTYERKPLRSPQTHRVER